MCLILHLYVVYILIIYNFWNKISSRYISRGKNYIQNICWRSSDEQTNKGTQTWKEVQWQNTLLLLSDGILRRVVWYNGGICMIAQLHVTHLCLDPSVARPSPAVRCGLRCIRTGALVCSRAAVLLLGQLSAGLPTFCSLWTPGARIFFLQQSVSWIELPTASWRHARLHYVCALQQPQCDVTDEIKSVPGEF
jgi:hypothetical protein